MVHGVRVLDGNFCIIGVFKGGILGAVWIALKVVCLRLLFFFFFFFHFTCFDERQGTIFTVAILFIHCNNIIHETHSHFIKKKNIKKGSHGTIHTFKNYFATVFSIFSFQFLVSATISLIQTNS